MATDFARRGDAGRGGARNYASRSSAELSLPQVRNLCAAADAAKRLGLPFTRMITIHWRAAAVPLEEMVAATGRYLDLLTKALARHGYATAWIYVHENGPQAGHHCHMLVHVPAAAAGLLSRLQRGWLRRITSQPYRRGVLLGVPIGGRLGLEISNPPLHADNLATVLGYVVKGASEAAMLECWLTHQQPGGLVIGKRCGTSQNIGPTARQRMGQE